MGLMSLVAVVPILVLLGVANIGGGGAGMDGATREAVDGVARAGRRLQTSSAASSDFATQLEMTVCLTDDHNTDSASTTPEQV